MGEVLDRIRARLAAGPELPKPARNGFWSGIATPECPMTLEEAQGLSPPEKPFELNLRPLHQEHYVKRSREEIKADEERRIKLREQWKEMDLRDELRRERARRDPEDLRRFVKYNLEPDEYKKLLAQQNGVCAICRDPDRGLCVDHNHKTGDVRALLCNGCNSAIGFLRESPLLARAAATYLEQYNKHQPQPKTYLEQLTKEFTGE